MNKTEDQWKEQLTKEQYQALRQKGTEAPFSGNLLDNKENGEYACTACGNLVFSSNKKFDSGSGWPSFTEAAENSVTLTPDNSHGMVRTEVSCAKCNGHLGHVFGDGPDDNSRYCINSVCLNFKANEK